MAFKTLAGSSNGPRSFKSFAKFADGETLEGYFTGFTPNKINTDRMDLNFQTAEGNQTVVSRAGKLTYLESDLEGNGQVLVVGAMTKLTRTGSYQAKGRAFDSPRYSIMQDAEDILDPSKIKTIEAPNVTQSSPEIQERIAKLKAEAKG